MTGLYACSLLTIFAGVFGASLARSEEPSQPLAHSHEEFSLKVAAPYDEVFPLFGAYLERNWATGFDPHFIHPFPAHDQEGMVFMWEINGKPSVWTNTAFDITTGHVQYVYFVSDVMVTLIDIHLSRNGEAETRVSVVYERTALKAEFNEEVRQHAKQDRTRNREWSAMLDGYLARTRSSPANAK
jgi:hypothetical protein